MRAIHTWMLIAATILIGLAAGLSANAQEFRVKVTTKDSDMNYLAVTSDRRVLGIVCRLNIVESAFNLASTYSADLVFPTDEGVLNLDNYRSTAPSRNYNPAKPAYRPLSPAHANLFCERPVGEFVFRIHEDTAELAARREVTVQSFGVGRRLL